MKGKYVMTISRTTVDKLGIKLYDKPAAVIAELVANSYDADSENVKVKLPLGKWLATGKGDKIVDQGYKIVVTDDGHGMAPEVINDFYLKVGPDRRLDPNRGPRSPRKKRHVMGRKGIGKLAPFGICKEIEVWSAGGDKTTRGFKIAHFIMKYDDINKETDAPYAPDIGKDDGQYSAERKTVITLQNFLRRRTADKETFHRQLARRFGLELPDFRIFVEDDGTNETFSIGHLNVEYEEATKIDLNDRPVGLEDGTKLPVRGWVAYAKSPYKNEEVAGVRIYARGKIVSSTRDFGLKAGFEGEFNIRSYLVGVIHADWLDNDKEEDLIRSDRQDILWDSEIGAAFQNWGQALLKELGTKSRTPMREKAWKVFLEKSKLEKEAKDRFGDEKLVEAAMKVGKTIGQIAHLEDLQDAQYVKNLREMVLTVTPHKMLVDKLSSVGEVEDAKNPLDLVARIFNDAKIAEAASLGQVAMERVQALTKLEKTIRVHPPEEEKTLQELLEGAPWLIDPRWTVLQANKTFDNLRSAFESWYKRTYGEEILTTALKKDTNKRPDFVMLHVGRNIELVEIKKPEHALEDQEFERIRGYRDSMNEFLDANARFKADFPETHVTLLCDKLKLGKTVKLAYDKLVDDGHLEKRTWEDILSDTRKVHDDFLEMHKTVKPS